MAFVKYTRPNPMLWYEMNYHTLLQLVPDLREEQACSLDLRTKDKLVYEYDMPGACLRIRLLEINRYTQHLQISNHFKTDKKLMPALCLNIRVYHDATLAEVVSCSGVGKLLPDYTYPNEKMLQKDEKRQANRLLYEWLSSARAYYRFEPVV